MNSSICPVEKCTGCSACLQACPKQCISMEPDALDALYPIIDKKKCVGCGICKRTCPASNNLNFRSPLKVWAAWSNDNAIRKTSASGGIAYEIYKYWIKKGGVAAGVVYNRYRGAYYILLEKEEDIVKTQNSKYTFSETNGIYKIIKQKLAEGVEVLFIGTPCQVAGLQGFLKGKCENLITIDLICHGMPPQTYLEQHIEMIENKKQDKASKLYFRDPKYNTYTYTFTLSNKNGEEFYNRKVLSTDNYQLGYHRSLIYRENCYHCLYARRERISDLTIGDFSGLGRYASCNYDKRNTSCILQNTKKGETLLYKIKNEITIDERPQGEAFDFDRQLNAPSIKHKNRYIFEELYKLTKSYEIASNKALRSEKRKAIRKALYLSIRAYIKKILMLIHLK